MLEKSCIMSVDPLLDVRRINSSSSSSRIAMVLSAYPKPSQTASLMQMKWNVCVGGQSIVNMMKWEKKMSTG